jgi:carotenoid cleavage dioxygenase-like enzyme
MIDRRTLLKSTAASTAAGFFFSHLPGHGFAQPAVPSAAVTPQPATPNPLLIGGFAPVHDELTVTGLPVRGAIPRDLSGVYMRNGPNAAYPPLSYTYPLDGDGMIHAVYLEDGKASYRNRFVETPGLKAERRAGRAIYGGVMRPVRPDAALVGTDGDRGLFKNTANINVIRHADRYLALWEGGLPHEITRELETVGSYDFSGKVRDAMTAHPKVDPATGELLMFRYAFEPPYLSFTVVDPTGAVVRQIPLDVPAPFMVHDFVITAQHVAFFLCPAVFDFVKAKSGGSLLNWEPERGTRIAVMRRDGGGAVRWFDTDAFFIFHFMNGYEADGRIVVDYIQHSWEAFGRPGGKRPSLWRATIDLASGTIGREQLDERPGEFPRVDPRVVGLPYRYGFMPVERVANRFGALARYDLITGRSVVRDFGAGREVDEPAFVARPGSRDEADGWIMTFVYDAASDRSSLVILDAREIDRAPVAEILLPQRVPHGFHGEWMAA